MSVATATALIISTYSRAFAASMIAHQSTATSALIIVDDVNIMSSPPPPLPPSRNEMSAEWPRTSRSIITRDSYTSIFHAAAATFRVWLRSRYILTLARGYYLRRMKNVRVKSCIWREVMWSEKVKRTFGNTLRSLEHLGDKCWQSSLTESSDRSQWGLSVYVRQVQGVSLYLSIKVVQVIEAL